jgi:hypothetical protein
VAFVFLDTFGNQCYRVHVGLGSVRRKVACNASDAQFR